MTSSRDYPNPQQGRRHVSETLHTPLESTSTDINHAAYALFNTSASTAKMVRKGLRAHIGAHGEPPIGLNYHSEMFFTQQGGLTNYEVRRSNAACDEK